MGTSIQDFDETGFREFARASISEFGRGKVDDGVFTEFAKRLRYVPASTDPGPALAKLLHLPHRIIYLAVPPSSTESILTELRAAALHRGASIIIEKPFGHDLVSARALNDSLHRIVPEERIYRIDHYLGKETVQNLLVFRFGHTLVERIWNRDVVSHVQLTVAEDLGVDTRGSLYEETGALRDIVQNHMFQLLALTCMSPPSSFHPEALRDEKVKVFQSIRPVHPSEVIRGQYTRGLVNGQTMPGYRELEGVSPGSDTETYVALRLSVDSWEWAGVPFYLRCGKALSTRRTEIVLFCRDVPLHLFEGTGIEALPPNRVTIRIQPDEGISFSVVAKEPGPTVREQGVSLDFSYGKSFKTQPAEAYERLLHDALMGDHTLFISQDETESAWRALQPVLESRPRINLYPAGSEGPVEAQGLLVSGAWESLSLVADDGDR